MAFKDEIDRVIAEEEKRLARLEKRKQMNRRLDSRKPPTYMAVLIGKFLYKYKKKKQPYVEHDLIEEEKISVLSLIKEDIDHLLLRRKCRKKPPIAGKDTFEDWKDYFEEDVK